MFAIDHRKVQTKDSSVFKAFWRTNFGDAEVSVTSQFASLNSEYIPLLKHGMKKSSASQTVFDSIEQNIFFWAEVLGRKGYFY